MSVCLTVRHQESGRRSLFQIFWAVNFLLFLSQFFLHLSLGFIPGGPQQVSQTLLDPRIRVWDSFFVRIHISSHMSSSPSHQTSRDPRGSQGSQTPLDPRIRVGDSFPAWEISVWDLLYISRYYPRIHSLGTESGIHSITYISIYDKPYILLYLKIVYIGTSARTRRKTL